MNSYLLLPLTFLKFWYFDTPREMIGYFVSLNKAFLKLFSLPILYKTLFKPLKNEYRQGLIRFSIAMGVFIKSILIFADTLLLLVLLTFEIVVFTGFLAFPVLTVWLLFW